MNAKVGIQSIAESLEAIILDNENSILNDGDEVSIGHIHGLILGQQALCSSIGNCLQELEKLVRD